MKPLAICLAALYFGAITSCFAASCPRYVGPAKFNNIPQSWGNDSGPIVDGFIDVKTPDGEALDSVQGVDLSRYNSIDFSKLKECGGEFAFIQLDAHFKRNLAGLKTEGLTAIPYSFFHLPPLLRHASNLPTNPSLDQIAELRERYAEAGRNAAESFLQSLESLSSKDPLTSVTLAGLTGRFVAVDVEESPLDKPSPGAAQRYGQFYAAAICSWVNTLAAHPEMSDVVPILYTFPAIYGQYLTYAFPEENRCLQGLPVWIARTFPDGGEAVHDPRAIRVIDQYVQRLCLVQGGNRCLIHQYTHRGVFMYLPTKFKTIPPHFDLDRFYVSTVISTGAEPQYIRVKDPFR